MMYLDKVAELSFFSEMEALAESSAHTAAFEGLDKVARRRPHNPIYNLRNGKKRKKRGLSAYFSRLANPAAK